MTRMQMGRQNNKDHIEATTTDYACINEHGLTHAEVLERRQAELTNDNVDVSTKPVAQIIREHTLSLFNAVNLVMALLVFTTGMWRNALFMLVVVINAVIGIVQELRAKHMVDKLTILTRKLVRVIRDGTQCELAPDELVLDDLICLSSGEQVPADAVVVSGVAMLDESLLTGESDAVEKSSGDELFSGSFVQAGSVNARLTRVGANGYAARLGAETKYIKPAKSEILDTLKLIIKIATSVLIPVGVALFLRTFLMDNVDFSQAILSTVAAIVGMIPQGLVLLVSTVLAIATTRLASKNVLVQQSYCVETLARVDVICLDKTGTITSGAMQVSELVTQSPYTEDEILSALASIMAANENDANATARALLSYVDSNGAHPYSILRNIPFSSAAKFSGCVCEGNKAYALGAAQFIFSDSLELIEPALKGFDALSRLLVLAEVDGFDENGTMTGDPQLMAVISLHDEIRSSANETIDYFKSQGVSVKIISGDDPVTASAIARFVGIEGAENYLDVSTVKDDSELADKVEDVVVFGRVTPHQKRVIVKALKQCGHTLAMTGDGVNDVLALKEADCSISVAEGSSAARNISEIVLADNDFSHIPDVVAEGRRSINNLERSSVLFLVKTVYSALLAIVCVIMPPYPFIPIQMTLISTAIIGIPSFVLALEPNHELVKGKYLINVFSRSLPASIAIVTSLIAAILWGRSHGFSNQELSSLCCYLTCLVGVALIISISWPLTPLRVCLIALVLAIVVLGSTVFAGFFSFSHLNQNIVISFGIIGLGSLVLFFVLRSLTMKAVVLYETSFNHRAKVKEAS